MENEIPVIHFEIQNIEIKGPYPKWKIWRWNFWGLNPWRGPRRLKGKWKCELLEGEHIVFPYGDDLTNNMSNENNMVICSLLKELIALGDREDSQGRFRVTLDYDNYHDGARVLDGDGNVIGECYDHGEEGVERQFIEAITRAVKENQEVKELNLINHKNI